MVKKRRVGRWLIRFAAVREMLTAYRQNPGYARHILRNLPLVCCGLSFTPSWKNSLPVVQQDSVQVQTANPLWDYFINHSQGNLIWKWEHYFDLYHRHLSRFVGQPAHVVEVGVFGGGSLDMWTAYFGDRCHVYGIDIEPECKKHERDNVSIFIGDQQDRQFWSAFKEQVSEVDILIDDGGHRPDQQITTLEEMLPHLQPGGVYICEDIHGIHNKFAAYAAGLIHQLNHIHAVKGQSATTQFQKTVHSIHFYPYALVIEKHQTQPLNLVSQIRGSHDLPFGKKRP